MCPLCVTTIAATAAGLGSAGKIKALVAKLRRRLESQRMRSILAAKHPRRA